MATAQEEPSLIQKDLLAKKLVKEVSSCQPEAKLYSTARTGLPKNTELRPEGPEQPDPQRLAKELKESARLRPERLEQSENTELRPEGPEQPDPQRLAEEPKESARLRPERLEQSKNTELRPERLEQPDPRQGAEELSRAVVFQSRLWLKTVAEQEPEDTEAGSLLDFVRIQTVTRQAARGAAQLESPYITQAAKGLLTTIRELQGTDPLCLRLKKELSDNSGREGYSLGQDSLLLYSGRVVVPAQKALTQELLYLYHDDQFAGHWGVEKTQELLERKFYWHGLARDVREYVTTCSTCQNIATPRHKPYGQLQSLSVPKQPWEEISLDFITQLPESCIGTKAHDAILVVVDRYTKMAQFIPTTTDLAAPEFAALFHEKIELKYGSPKGIVSDRDSRITSKFWAEVCSYSLIKRRLSTAFHPQTDGQTEILNRILENYLRAYTSLEQMNWAKLLPSAEFAYNNSRSSSTKISPFMALYGYNPELRVDIDAVDDITRGEIPAAQDRIRRLQELRNRL